MGANVFEFKYSISGEDYIEFNRYHFFSASANKANVIILRWSLPILFITTLYLVSVIGSDTGFMWSMLILFVLSSILWVIFFNKIVKFTLKKTIKKMKKFGKLPYDKNVILQFREDCFIETTDDCEIKARYLTIEKITVAESAVYIYINTMQACIIPLVVFESFERQSAFLRFLTSKATHLVRLPDES